FRALHEKNIPYFIRGLPHCCGVIEADAPPVGQTQTRTDLSSITLSGNTIRTSGRSPTQLVPLRQDGDRSPYGEENGATSQSALLLPVARSFRPAVPSDGDAPWRASRNVASIPA